MKFVVMDDGVSARQLLRIVAHRTDASRDVKAIAMWPQSSSTRPRAPHTTIMANRGYDVVVDVDQEVCSHQIIIK